MLKDADEERLSLRTTRQLTTRFVSASLNSLLDQLLLREELN